MKRKMFFGADRLLFEKASQLRKQQTFTEEILWNYLRTKPLGFKFRRQHPFSCYILDFYCHSLKLAIEVDDSIHQFEEEGLTFLRFTIEQIRLKTKEVIRKIETYLKEKVEISKDTKA